MWERVEQGAYLTTISIVRKIVYVRRGFMEGDPKELKAGDGPLREEVSKESFFVLVFGGGLYLELSRRMGGVSLLSQSKDEESQHT